LKAALNWNRTIAAPFKTGDITLIDAARPCSIYWQEKSRQISRSFPVRLLSNSAVSGS
jgi:AraC family transcriptional activator of tynA and feaB